MGLDHKYVLKTEANDHAHLRGEWVTATDYEIGDWVVHDGSGTWQVYECKEAHTSGASTEPGTGGIWTSKWTAANTFSQGPQGETGATGSAGPSTVNQGRLTTETGVPVSTSDRTAQGTLYFTPFTGKYIGLYNGVDTWTVRSFSEISVSLAAFDPVTGYDVFAYDNSGSVALETTKWKQVVATNSPTAGSDKTINLSNTTGVAVGDTVGVWDAGHAELCYVKTVNVGVSIVVETLANGYTLPTVCYCCRSSDVSRVQGVWSKSSDSTRRLVGTIFTGTTAGTVEDTLSERGVCNVDTVVQRPVYKAFAETWSCASSASFRACNALTSYRVVITQAVNEHPVNLTARVSANAVAGNQVYRFGFAKNKTTAQTGGGGFAYIYSVTASHLNLHAVYNDYLGVGRNCMGVIEKSDNVTTTVGYSGSGLGPGIYGFIMA
jgi:hypothetical protein